MSEAADEAAEKFVEGGVVLSLPLSHEPELGFEVASDVSSLWHADYVAHSVSSTLVVLEYVVWCCVTKLVIDNVEESTCLSI